MNCTEMTSKRRTHVMVDEKEKWGRWEDGKGIWENGKKIRRAERKEGEERSDEEGPQKLLCTKQKE